MNVNFRIIWSNKYNIMQRFSAKWNFTQILELLTSIRNFLKNKWTNTNIGHFTSLIIQSLTLHSFQKCQKFVWLNFNFSINLENFMLSNENCKLKKSSWFFAKILKVCVYLCQKFIQTIIAILVFLKIKSHKN